MSLFMSSFPPISAPKVKFFSNCMLGKESEQLCKVVTVESSHSESGAFPTSHELLHLLLIIALGLALFFFRCKMTPDYLYDAFSYIFLFCLVETLCLRCFDLGLMHTVFFHAIN